MPLGPDQPALDERLPLLPSRTTLVIAYLGVVAFGWFLARQPSTMMTGTMSVPVSQDASGIGYGASDRRIIGQYSVRYRYAVHSLPFPARTDVSIEVEGDSWTRAGQTVPAGVLQPDAMRRAGAAQVARERGLPAFDVLAVSGAISATTDRSLLAEVANAHVIGAVPGVWLVLCWFALRSHRHEVRRKRWARGLCPACSYNRAGIDGPCPECGHTPVLAGGPDAP